MIKTPFGLHAIIHFDTISKFKLDISSIKHQKCIWLKGNENNIIKNSEIINKIVTDNGLFIIVDSELVLEEMINVFAFISKNYESISLLKTKYPQVKIGGIADNLADTKNIELFAGDFVYLGSLDTIGTSPYIAITPKEPDYEWQFIDITIPIISFGKSDYKLLGDLTNKANIFGHACSIEQFKALNKSTYRFTSD